MIYVGTSGFSYQSWKGLLYPEELPRADYLQYYSKIFNTTEINNTFYRTPSTEMTTRWASQVPSEFRFTLKLGRWITHYKKLVDCDREMEDFLRVTDPLRGNLACLLVQLAPGFQKNLEVLGNFLEKFSSEVPLALEFRHGSWFESETYRLLERYRAALVVVDAADQEVVRKDPSSFVYLRLRRTKYDDQKLDEWARWITSLKSNVFVYVRHHPSSPQVVWDLEVALKSI